MWTKWNQWNKIELDGQRYNPSLEPGKKKNSKKHKIPRVKTYRVLKRLYKNYIIYVCPPYKLLTPLGTGTSLR